jgi:hypothetical protein
MHSILTRFGSGYRIRIYILNWIRIQVKSIGTNQRHSLEIIRTVLLCPYSRAFHRPLPVKIFPFSISFLYFSVSDQDPFGSVIFGLPGSVSVIICYRSGYGS